MADISPDGQNLAKALDSVASPSGAPQAFGGSGSVAASTAATQPTAAVSDPEYPPIVPPHSPIAPPQLQSNGQVNANQAATPAADAPAVSSAYSTYAAPSSNSAYASPSAVASTSASTATETTSTSTSTAAPSADAGPLDAIKKEALDQLRPLVGKLGVEPQEKFDTYLLLIRSTDDSNLIAPAYDAAKAIPDESRRAEALLDIIKEIDYLSHPKNGS